jgi:DNA polymerase-1
MAKLVLIDGNAILHRAFHALPPMTNKMGEPTNAIYGLVSMFLRVIQDLKPTHIAVAFDEKEPTFRHKELATYQSQRPPMASELSSQFEKARAFFKAAKVPVYSKSGFEADDVIGTIADRAVKGEGQEVNEVVVVTGDRDILQLINNKVKLYMPIAGLANAKLFGVVETIERMGVPPTQIPDYKALVGDASDNYFGVPGIGPKTAITLLSKYKTIETIYKNLPEIPDKVREKLEKNKESAYQSLRLSTIVKDVPVEPDFNSMQKWQVDSPEVIKLFEKFSFRTLTERIKKVGKGIEEEKQGALF